MQKLRNPGAFSDSELDHCEYPQLRVKLLAILENYAAFRFQEGVEVFHKCRKYIEKGRVETVVHVLELIVFNVPGRIRKLDYIVGIATPETCVYASAESEKPVNVGGIELEEAGDIAVGNAVGTLQTESKHSAFPYKDDHIAYCGYKNQGKDRKETQT